MRIAAGLLILLSAVISGFWGLFELEPGLNMRMLGVAFAGHAVGSLLVSPLGIVAGVMCIRSKGKRLVTTTSALLVALPIAFMIVVLSAGLHGSLVVLTYSDALSPMVPTFLGFLYVVFGLLGGTFGLIGGSSIRRPPSG